MAKAQDANEMGGVSITNEALTNGTLLEYDPDRKLPNITLYHLQCSRSIRIAFLLEMLGLPYTAKCYERNADGSVPEEFRTEVGKGMGMMLMGKAPVLRDGEIIIEESGAITEYLCETYDPLHQLIPADEEQRIKVLTYIHAAEATFLLHGLIPFYVRRASLPTATANHAALTADTGHDLDHLDADLAANNGRYLVGSTVTAADTMMGFSIQFVLKFGLVPEGKEWPKVREWLARVEGNVAYLRAVQKTGFKLEL